jgi:hypothetical protein
MASVRLLSPLHERTPCVHAFSSEIRPRRKWRRAEWQSRIDISRTLALGYHMSTPSGAQKALLLNFFGRFSPMLSQPRTVICNATTTLTRVRFFSGISVAVIRAWCIYFCHSLSIRPRSPISRAATRAFTRPCKASQRDFATGLKWHGA